MSNKMRENTYTTDEFENKKKEAVRRHNNERCSNGEQYKKKECDNDEHKDNLLTDKSPENLVRVGFASLQAEPTDNEVYDMVEKVISQVLGYEGLSKIIKPGDKVVIKVNVLGSCIGARGEKGRGCITDPRIVRYVAEKVREIIGTEGTADLKVIDTVFYPMENPSIKTASTSFYWARLERSGDNSIDENDVCYDSNADGYLDGTSKAKLVNLESINEDGRQEFKVKVGNSEEISVYVPKFFRTKEQADASGDSVDEYCDVFIGIPVFKSHGLAGITGALKLNYGVRYGSEIHGDPGRYSHDGLVIYNGEIQNKQPLLNYLCAQHLVRNFDFVVMDCLTGNRKGPMNAAPSVATNYFQDSPVDYILTNAIMASVDSVAIDTVEAVLGGYEPESIELLKTGNDMGVGTNDPKDITVGELNDFYKHRQYLYNNYPRNKYPFEYGWGSARTLPDKTFMYSVNLTSVQNLGKGMYSINYEIADPANTFSDLRRIELWNSSTFIKYKNEFSKKGSFILDINEAKIQKGSTVIAVVIIWDRLFNSINSPELIFTV